MHSVLALSTDNTQVGSVPTPGNHSAVGPGVLLCPILSPQPLTVCFSAALLIHSILAAASCVTETTRNFLFGF